MLFQTTVLVAVAMAAPSIPQTGIKAEFSSRLMTRVNETIFFASFSLPVMFSIGITAPDAALKKKPADRVCNEYEPFINSEPKRESTNEGKKKKIKNRGKAIANESNTLFCAKFLKSWSFCFSSENLGIAMLFIAVKEKLIRAAIFRDVL